MPPYAACKPLSAVPCSPEGVAAHPFPWVWLLCGLALRLLEGRGWSSLDTPLML